MLTVLLFQILYASQYLEYDSWTVHDKLSAINIFDSFIKLLLRLYNS
jgi:hypothetical protein